MDWMVALTSLLLTAAPHAHAAPLDTARIEQLTGAKGKLDRTAGVFKVSVPRSELAVTVGGVKLTPPSGLTSWAAFAPAGSAVMVMGDMVLTEDQVNPVMSVALDNGLEVTALHNHFLGESPRVMFMHIGGSGDLESIASAVGSVGTSMGVNTWAAFSGADERAVVDGDFAMLESELQPVLKTLRHADIQIVAIHQHMTGETPRIMFLHYWGIGRVEELARGVRAALDRMAAR